VPVSQHIMDSQQHFNFKYPYYIGLHYQF